MKIKIKLVNQLDIYGNKSYSAYDIEGLDYHFYMGSGVVTSELLFMKLVIHLFILFGLTQQEKQLKVY